MEARVHEVLRDAFGFDALREGQGEVIERLLAGRSVLAVFPTGGGKSLCYQLPALLLEGLTLVVSPLIALMKDQIDALQARGVAAARLDSSLDADAHRATWDDLRAGRTRLLYVAPERFQNERFMASLRALPIAMLAVDEAHCISEWGHNFRPDYLKLASIARELRVGRVLALTATATPKVAEGIRDAFGIAAGDHVHTGFHRPNLFLRMTPVHADRRDAHLIERLRALPRGPTIVYVTLQHTAERVARLLSDAGFPAHAYHAGMDADVRARVQDAFMGSSDGIVVATIAFGMGIDKADIRAVLHYNLPKALENHAQEIGRAGRDGLPATCEVFACPSDAVTLGNFAWGDTPTVEAVAGVVREVLSLGPTFDVSRADLSSRHDIRILVISTLLTYLELDGVLASTAPFYDTYRFRPQRTSAEILADFHGERAAFLRRVLARSTRGRTWFSIDLTAAAEALGEPRQRLVSALEFLAQRGDLELKVSGVRNGYRVVRAPSDPQGLSEALWRRFVDAEARDVGRMREILALAGQPGCITRSLLAYFGEALEGPCGHCDRCAGEVIPPMPELVPYRFGEADRALVAAVRAEGQQALGSARQLARFLCGLTSPAASRAKLARHPRWGVWSGVPFPEVLSFVEASS